MSTPVLPDIIRGPAVAIHNGYTFYVAGNIRVNHRRQLDPTPSDMHPLGDTVASHIVELTFTPVGEIESLAKYLPYGPSNLAAASPFGTSIFGSSDKTTVIHTLSGTTHTFHRTGILRTPTLNMSPRKTLFGEMAIACLGASNTQVTDAAYHKTLASSAFSDTNFDETKVVKDIYTASLGARATPYDALGARTGFEFSDGLVTEEVPDDNVGIADILITDIKPRISFDPNNLGEAEFDALLNIQGADAFKPGQYVGRGPSGTPEDLVVDSDVLTVTLHNAGITEAEQGFGKSVDRNGRVTFMGKSTFTAGVIDPLFTLTVN